jgi:hypothetical protein
MASELQAVESIEIARADGGLIRIDLLRISRHLKQLERISLVNPHTAPSLLNALNEGWMDVNGLAQQATAELVKMRAQMKLRQAQVLVITTDAVLEKLGHSRPSKELRQAVVEIDPEYQRLREKADFIEVARDWLKLQADGLVNGYTAVKKIIGGNQLPYAR